LLLLSSQAYAQGVEIERGTPAPFSGILIGAGEFAAVVAAKNAEIEAARSALAHAEEIAAINQEYWDRDRETLQQRISILQERNLALEEEMRLLEDRVDGWRFGWGLLILKSPW